MLFPRCEACDNTLDPSGKDMVKELKAKLRRVMKEVWGDKVSVDLGAFASALVRLAYNVQTTCDYLGSVDFVSLSVS